MSCSQAQWLHGYFDGELDAVRAAEFEAHLEACPACAQALAAQQELRGALGAADLYVKAPASLRARVRAGLPSSGAVWAPRAIPWRSLAAAASLLLVSFGLWQTVPAWRDGGPDRELSRQVLDAHLRSLQLTHLTDVASTDQHTVKPWFVGKLDFAPAVVDLASFGFPLVGGRLDVVGGQSVAALVYARRQHVINVFVWPSVESDAALRAGSERGYTWVRWTRRGMRFWAVSDVAAVDLEEFARRLSGS
jgi:anti-sigma factor RsiW